MDTFVKATALALISAVLILIVGKRDKDIAMLLSLAAGCMLCVLALGYLEPVLAFVRRLQILGQLDSELTRVLLKAVGICLLAELAGMICADAGNTALAKVLQIVATGTVLWLSLPLFTALIDLIGNILGEV